MNNYIPIKKKRNRRSNPDTIIMAARPSGGSKNKVRIRVTIPKKVLKQYLGKIPKTVSLHIDTFDNHRFAITVCNDGLGFTLTQTSTNIYSFWCNGFKTGASAKGTEYLYNIDYAESIVFYVGQLNNTFYFTVNEVNNG